MIPVMIWGILIMRKRYGWKDFGIAMAITGGCTLFLVTGTVKAKVRGGTCLPYIHPLAGQLRALAQRNDLTRQPPHQHLQPHPSPHHAPALCMYVCVHGGVRGGRSGQGGLKAPKSQGAQEAQGLIS